MSDGFRSILSLTFELIRQLFQSFEYNRVFHVENENIYVDIPGVVMIDEIDAHLHPSWQTKIGNWFTKYFPKIQFIVTTHSPLICRNCENGTIWKLVNHDEKSCYEITGNEKDKLIYGNVLDAYGTDVFGNTNRSKKSNDSLKRLGELNALYALGYLENEEDIEERNNLLKIHSTDAPTGF